MWISPNFQTTAFTPPLTLDEKISLFEDRTVGWQLGIANSIINGSPSSAGQADAKAIPHSGYAVLHILLSYFEMIGTYRAGFTESGRSARFFKEGVHHVFPQLAAFPTAVVDALLDVLYAGGRCGLYHGGMTDSRIMLSGDLNAAMAFDPTAELLAINPHLLAPALLEHFHSYIADLRNPGSTALRTNFQARFNAESE